MRTGHVLDYPLSRGAGENPERTSRGRPRFASVASSADGGAAGRQWWRALRRGSASRGASDGPAAGTQALWYRTLRRWSPGLIPPLLGTLLLLAAGVLATHHFADQPPIVDPHTLLMLFIVYLVVGTVFGLLLYLATDVTAWWRVLLGGVAVYLIGSTWVIAGLPLAVLLGIALAALAARYRHQHTLAVPEGHVLVTTFAGGYHRTVQKGRALLLPGERAAGTFDTTERRFTCPTQRSKVPIGTGEAYTARAAATVAYQLMPGEAYRAALAPEQWEQRLHDLVCTSLQLALEDWGARMIETEGAVPEGMLARTMLAHLREQARAQGVRVAWVNVRDIWLAPGGETLPVDEWDTDDEDEDEDDAEEPIGAATQASGRGRAPALPPVRAPVPPPVPQPQPQAQPQAQPQPVAATPAAAGGDGGNGGNGGNAEDEDRLEERDLLAPDVLADAYEAVREGHIHDPATIRELAQAFLHIAADAELNAEFPYDAMQAAQILLERAKRLERDQRSQARQFDGN